MIRKLIAIAWMTAHLTLPFPAAAAPEAVEIRIPREAPAPAEFAQDREAQERRAMRPVSHRRRWGLAVSGAGLALGVGLAAWLKDEADDRYELYLDTANPARARDHFEAAERYDRATLLGWVIAQASFVGLVYFLVTEEERPLIPARGEPLVRATGEGIEVGVVLCP